MTTKYLAQDSQFRPEIKAVEVERETDTSVWIKTRRWAKRSNYESYFDTWEEAQAHLLSKAEAAVIGARRQLDFANGLLGNVKGLKKPEPQEQA